MVFGTLQLLPVNIDASDIQHTDNNLIIYIYIYIYNSCLFNYLYCATRLYKDVCRVRERQPRLPPDPIRMDRITVECYIFFFIIIIINQYKRLFQLR